MKKFVFALVFAFLGLVVATNAQNPNVAKPAPSSTNISTAPTTALTEPEFAGVFYARNEEGRLTNLPRQTPEIKSKFRSSLGLKPQVPVEVNTTLVVRIEGSGDPSSAVMLAPLEDGGKKISAKFTSTVVFAKGIPVSPRSIGNRTFEIATTGLSGDYAIAVRSETPFTVPDVYLFRVK
jgi:hypothetical protein